MKEKFILYILIVLTVITNSKCIPIVKTTNDDINETTAYWTPERMINAKPFGDEKDEFSTNTSNITSVNDFKVPNAVGKFFGHDPAANSDFFCTASVINTDNGNIGLTAAHCLYKFKDIRFTKLSFCPGFNNGCTFGIVPVNDIALFIKDGNFYYDYGLIKFAYEGKLQDKTGSFNWEANPGDDIEVTILGYPVNGELQCAKNGNALCMWQGNMHRQGSFREVPVRTGNGSSGGPWIKNYDQNTNSGTVVGNTSTSGPGLTTSPIYAYDEFVKLIQELSG